MYNDQQHEAERTPANALKALLFIVVLAFLFILEC
jgi:hypothetical protein